MNIRKANIAFTTIGISFAAIALTLIGAAIAMTRAKVVRGGAAAG